MTESDVPAFRKWLMWGAVTWPPIIFNCVTRRLLLSVLTILGAIAIGVWVAPRLGLAEIVGVPVAIGLITIGALALLSLLGTIGLNADLRPVRYLQLHLLTLAAAPFLIASLGLVVILFVYTLVETAARRDDRNRSIGQLGLYLSDASKAVKQGRDVVKGKEFVGARPSDTPRGRRNSRLALKNDSLPPEGLPDGAMFADNDSAHWDELRRLLPCSPTP